MARLITIGFEDTSSPGTGLVWHSRGSPGSSISSTTKRTGNYAGQITSLNSGVMAGWGFLFGNGDTTNPRFIRFYLNIATAPSAENRIFSVRNNNPSWTTPTSHLYITLDNSRQLRLYDEDGVIGSPSSALSTDTWYRIEFEVNASAAAGSHIVRARVDGTEFAGASNRNLSDGYRSFQLGGNLDEEAQTTGSWFFDDIAMNDNTGSFQNSYPGEGSVVMLTVAGTDNDAGWTPTGAATDYEAVDEVPADNATTYISSNTASDLSEFTLTNTTSEIGSGDTITLVEVEHIFSGAAASDTNASFAVSVRAASGGTRETGDTINPSSASWNTNKRISNDFTTSCVLYDLPGGSTTAWTKADLDAMVVGVELIAVDTNAARVTSIAVMVEFVPSGGGGAEITLTGAMTSSGTLVREPQLTRAGAAALSGLLVRQPRLTRTGTAPTSGSLVRQAGLRRTGSSDSSGVLTKEVQLTLPGTSSFSGSLRHYISTRYLGTLTSSGSLQALKVALLSIGGTLTSSGSLVKRVSKSFTGSTTSTGALVKRPLIRFSGTTTPSGSLAALKVALLAISGSMSSAGSLIRQVTKTFQAEISPVGTLRLSLAKLFEGTLQPSGSLTAFRLALLELSGSMSSTGQLIRRVLKSYSGTAGSSGSLRKRVSRSFTGALTSFGTLSNILQSLTSIIRYQPTDVRLIIEYTDIGLIIEYTDLELTSDGSTSVTLFEGT